VTSQNKTQNVVAKLKDDRSKTEALKQQLRQLDMNLAKGGFQDQGDYLVYGKFEVLFIFLISWVAFLVCPSGGPEADCYPHGQRL
jgi:hypothetical protein